LRKIPFGCETLSQVGIRRLLNNQTYLAAYPLHEGCYNKDPPTGAEKLDRRVNLCVALAKFFFHESSASSPQVLYLEWAQAACWHKQQPLWQVRNYFGDKIGLYFAWLGFYTKMLVPAAVVGLVCFVYGCLSLESQDNIPR
jgi:Calcium-activated chloride channel/Dimerisation domain of Ca+-activated chloride-channel, anoctamin